MRIRHVSIQNFRGIKSLEWAVSERLTVLIGAGDTCKTTVIEAIGSALSPNWSVPVSDGDFHDCDVDAPINIDVTLTDVPSELLREDKFGHWLRGVASDGSVRDEPADEDDPALTIRFQVDDSLEPTWTLWKQAMSDHVARISGRDRERFGVFHVDDAKRSHLRWAPGSALTHLGGQADVSAMVSRAHREARRAIFDNPLEALKLGAARASAVLRRIGGADLANPRPGLDPSRMGRGASLVLHDGVVPATQLGLGSQRLASLAFQLDAFEQQAVVLVDEVELGLEPHRLLHVIDVLRRRAEEHRGQVLLTTHSPLVVEAVRASELHVVRAISGHVTVMQVPEALADMKRGEPQATVRSGPSAMLAKRVVVCEGKAEVGLFRSLARSWDKDSERPLALAGTAFRHGNGSEAPLKARCLAELGYETALVHDSDLSKDDKGTFDARVEDAILAGVRRFAWAPGCALEDQIARSLPESALGPFAELAAELLETDDREKTICQAVGFQLGDDPPLSGLEPLEWASQSGKSLSDVRAAVGRAARKNGWFKTETKGEYLGELLLKRFSEIGPLDHLVQTITELRSWSIEALSESAAVEEDDGPQIR